MAAAVILVAAVAIVVGRSVTRNSDELRLSGVVEAREIRIGSKLSGRVTEALVREGDQVGSGTVLVRFDPSELQAERAQLQARLAQAKAEFARLSRGYRQEEILQAEANAAREAALLQALKEGPRPQELAQARAEFEAASAEAKKATGNFERISQLHKTGDVAAQMLDDAQARRDSAVNRTEAVRQRLALLEAGTRREEIEAATERVRQAQAALSQAREGFRTEEVTQAKARVAEARALLQQNEVRLREMELHAPAPSVVETISVRPGDLVPAGRTVVTLLESSQVWVRAYVPEPDLGRIKVGQKVVVTTDTFPDRNLTGAVEQISNEAEFLPRNVQTRSDRERQVFGIKIRAADDGGLLKPGMAAQVTF
jgi:HlyD family secretion protein